MKSTEVVKLVSRRNEEMGTKNALPGLNKERNERMKVFVNSSK